MPETVNGLPLHPLVVHAAVVLIPLVFALTILVVVRQAWRRSLGWWAVLLAAGTVGATALAAESGEALAEVVGEPLRHASLGEGLPYFAAAMFVMLTVYVVWGAVWDWRSNHQKAQKSLVQGAVPAESVVPVPAASTIEDPAVATRTASGSAPPAVSQPSGPARRTRRVPLSLTILGILAVVVGALTTAQAFRVGESGAQAVWAGFDDAAQADPSGAPARVITMAEVTTHATSTDCWTVIGGTVYDLTAWVTEHPGGAGPIQSLCGTDGTSSFQTQHAGQARPEAELTGFAIGTVK